MKKFFSVILLLSLPVFVFPQQTEMVDFEKLKAHIQFLPESKTVKGNLSYTFTIQQKTDSIFLDAKKMQVELSKTSPLKAKLKSTSDKIWIYNKFKAGKTYTLDFSYKVENPKQALYFVGWQENTDSQIWSQGQGKDNSYWIPSIDDVNDKIIFELTFEVPKNYKAVSNGKLINHKSTANSEIWQYKMNKPMSSYLMGVAVGKYKSENLTSSSGIPIQLFYQKQDSLKLEPTYRYTQKIFDFLEKEIGVDYPWENYKQIPVRDFLYAGMENTTTTIFAESLMTDSIGFFDRNYVRVNAHELAHQWFGNLITQKSSADHWLHEGFATYYALLVKKEIFGEDEYYLDLFQKAEQLQMESDQGKGESLLNPKAGYLTFYDKGAWALHILKEKVGERNFKKSIQKFLEKYQYQNVSVQDFLEVVESQSHLDLTDFKENWLKQSAFQAEEALESLKKSEFIKKYMEFIALREVDFNSKKNLLKQALSFPINKHIAQEAVSQLATEKPGLSQINLYRKAFKTNDLSVRQGIAASLKEIPDELKSEYETLLKDDSYQTQEHALLHLWTNFPEERKTYLDVLKDTDGFYEKNIRILWLTLSLATPDYLVEQKPVFFEELKSYTSPSYDYSIRLNAFAHLYQLNVFQKEIFLNLMQATTHPVWRFRNFARELLQELVKEKSHQHQLELLKNDLSEKQQEILDKAIKNI